MSISTGIRNDTISIGLAHEFIMALTRRGITKKEIAIIVGDQFAADDLCNFIANEVKSVNPFDRDLVQCRELIREIRKQRRHLSPAIEILPLNKRIRLKVKYQLMTVGARLTCYLYTRFQEWARSQLVSSSA